MIITLFESLEAIGAFAGNELDFGARHDGSQTVALPLRGYCGP
jgi:hypothetical protein